MSINSILANGMQSMQASINRTSIAGSNLNIENGNFAAKMVEMRQSEISVKAAANIIKVSDEMLGTMIDLRA